jgi:hypothetical protein
MTDFNSSVGALRAQLTRDRAEIETWLDDVSKVSTEYKIGLGSQTIKRIERTAQCLKRPAVWSACLLSAVVAASCGAASKTASTATGATTAGIESNITEPPSPTEARNTSVQVPSTAITVVQADVPASPTTVQDPTSEQATTALANINSWGPGKSTSFIYQSPKGYRYRITLDVSDVGNAYVDQEATASLPPGTTGYEWSPVVQLTIANDTPEGKNAPAPNPNAVVLTARSGADKLAKFHFMRTTKNANPGKFFLELVSGESVSYVTPLMYSHSDSPCLELTLCTAPDAKAKEFVRYVNSHPDLSLSIGSGNDGAEYCLEMFSFTPGKYVQNVDSAVHCWE